MQRAILELRRWFRLHDILTDDITLIVNVSDPQVAAKLDFYIKQEMDPLLPEATSSRSPLSSFKLFGLQIKIESPVHEPVNDG